MCVTLVIYTTAAEKAGGIYKMKDMQDIGENSKHHLQNTTMTTSSKTWKRKQSGPELQVQMNSQYGFCYYLYGGVG